VTALDKSPDAFRTISEVGEDLDLPQHVLRFWETRFASIRPLKRGGGRRYYRPDDVDLLKGIRQLLYGQGYTIKGVQRILKEDGVRFVQAIGRGEQVVSRPQGDESDADDGADLGAFEAVPAEAAIASPASTEAAGQSLALPTDDLERLRVALDDLRECRRILGTLRAD
jgi:DNA-binding transcriptional MerR regulator